MQFTLFGFLLLSCGVSQRSLNSIDSRENKVLFSNHVLVAGKDSTIIFAKRILRSWKEILKRFWEATLPGYLAPSGDLLRKGIPPQQQQGRHSYFVSKVPFKKNFLDTNPTSCWLWWVGLGGFMHRPKNKTHIKTCLRTNSQIRLWLQKDKRFPFSSSSP